MSRSSASKNSGAIIGRRGGKTRAIAVLASYIAALVDFSDVLAPGEWASLPILSHTVDQAQKCYSYIDGIFSGVPALKKLVVEQTRDTHHAEHARRHRM